MTMTDVRSRFRSLDRVPPPDLWTEATRRAEVEGPLTRPSVRPLALAAVLLLLALIAGAIAVGSGLLHLRWPLPTAPALSWEQVPLPADGGPNVPSTGEAFFSYPLLYVGDHFLSYPPNGGHINRSADGMRWETSPNSSARPFFAATRDGTMLFWGYGGTVSLLRPDGSSSSHDFGCCVGVADAAIGPRGIVVLLSSDSAFEGGWFSENGETWSRIVDPPSSPGTWQATPVAATADGFYARTIDGNVWRSEDGLDWSVIGSDSQNRACQADPIPGTCYAAVIPWREGVVIPNTGVPRYEYWTADGLEVLTTGQATGLAGLAAGNGEVLGAGPLGILAVDRDAGQVLFSPDGETWEGSQLPAGHSWSDDFMGHYPSVAVGEDVALVVLWEQGPGHTPGDGSTDIPTLWRVTPP